MFRILKKYRLLINTNRMKYFKYAFGEIILVVIGILIALGINNWNEDRKDAIKKKELQRALKAEFEVNLKQLDQVLYYDYIVVQSSQELLDIKKDEIFQIHPDSIKKTLQNTSWLWTFDPLNGALRSSVSSGTIHLLNNDSLINLLFSWEDVVNDARENEDRTLDLRLDSKTVLEKHIRSRDYRGIEHKNLGESFFESNYHDLLNDPLFEDYISERHTTMEEAVQELELVRKQNMLILDLLEEEIESSK